ncbi:MAG: hypothetical protein K2I60_04215 [Oscillospiraceae bacterium]|nr:hypothetical protein [Oscillospiraceae bacterium]
MKRRLVGVTAIILVMAIFSSSVFSVFAQASEVETLKTEVIDKSAKQPELQNSSLPNDMEDKLHELYKYLSIDEKGMATLNPTPEIKNSFTNEEYKKITNNIDRTNKMVGKGVANRQSNGDLEITAEKLNQYISVDKKGIKTLNLTPEIKSLFTDEEYNEIKSSIESNSQQAIVKIKAIDLNKKEEAIVENPIEEPKDAGMEVSYHAFYVELKMSKAKAEQVADIIAGVAKGVFVIGAIGGIVGVLETLKVIKTNEEENPMATIFKKVFSVFSFVLGLVGGHYLDTTQGMLKKKIAKGKHGAILRIYYFGWMSSRSW